MLNVPMAKTLRKGPGRPKKLGSNRARKGKQPRPTGPFFQIDGAWKAAIRAAIAREGISQAELARRIGASPGSIVLLFKDETVQTRLVPAIHKALDLGPPASMAAAA